MQKYELSWITASWRAVEIDQSQISKLEHSERRLDILDYLRSFRT
jgi:hypothetical protein